MEEKKRKKTSEIWNYFYPLDEEKEHATCSFCSHKFSYKTTTSNLKKHLKSKHSDMVRFDGGGEVITKDEDGNISPFITKKPLVLQKPRVPKDLTISRPKEEGRDEINENGNIVKTTHLAYLEDEFDFFAKYMASQLRQLPILNALRVQEQIQSLVTKERQTCVSHDALATAVGQEQYPQYTIECTTTPATAIVETS